MSDKKGKTALAIINEWFDKDYKSLDDIPKIELVKMLIASILAAEATFDD